MKVSIALATFNGERFLWEQLESFCQQTRLPDEVVISDDASSDSTLEIIKKFAETAPFTVRWSQNETTLGFAQNFNLALQKTIGDVVFLSDQDDVWFPDKIKRMLDLAQQHPDKLLFMNDALVVDEQLNSNEITLLEYLKFLRLSHEYFMYGCCMSIRRELLDLVLPIPPDISAHDFWIVTIADGIRKKFVSTSTLQMYRRHHENVTKFYWNWTKKLYPRLFYYSYHFKIVFQLLYSKIFSKEIHHINEIGDSTILQWIEQTQQNSSCFFLEDLERFHSEYIQKSQSIKSRNTLRTLSISKRLSAVIRFWRQGGYQRFSGIQSAVRDVIFPLG